MLIIGKNWRRGEGKGLIGNLSTFCSVFMNLDTVLNDKSMNEKKSSVSPVFLKLSDVPLDCRLKFTYS